jgi:hypothetical protein
MALEPLDPGALKWLEKRTFTSADIKGRKIAIFSDQGLGKTVLAAKLGESNLFVTDEEGILSLKNHPELDQKSEALLFDGRDDAPNGIGYTRLKLALRACENGQFIGRNGKPVDNVVLDTVSGIVGTEIRRIIEDREIQTDKGKLAENIPTQPTYLLSEQNFAPLMRMIAGMTNCSVTLLAHLRVGDKSVPGASTRPDMHGAAYKLMAKYVSVMGWLHKGGPTGRQIRVMPGDMVAAKTRLNFGKSILTDEEFVEQIAKWKAGQ